MRILMLGWEFPPFISGGLGTACHGLTRALDRNGHEILFVLPREVEPGAGGHVRLIGTGTPGAPSAAGGAGADADAPAVEGATSFTVEGFSRARFLGVPSPVVSPYGSGGAAGLETLTEEERRVIEARRAEAAALRDAGVEEEAEHAEGAPGVVGGADYSGDVFRSARSFARRVVRLCKGERFDVIHAHDWMTYPAGMALARATGRPLVAHIHSTEFDRSGEHVNQAIYDIERRGMHAAMRVIAVSMLTKSIVVARYGLEPDKVRVVYNGVDFGENEPEPSRDAIARNDRIVLFLGRITMQKGPEYFVHAAKRVLERMDNVKFLVAGSGDMAKRMIELAAEMGIGHKVLFTGFLRGRDVERVFRMADLYVMPSVSEPFGIAPLEALSNGTPVIISKQSGVSEVLRHALKVDFWDTREMANKILAVLRHPPLGQELRRHGVFEVRGLTWDGAAERCARIYELAAGAVGPVPTPAPPLAKV